MNLELKTAPAKQGLTLAETKLHLRVDADTEDTLITSLIKAATQTLDGRDGWLGRALITQTWLMRLPGFPTAGIRLPFPPLQTVESVKYYDAGGTLQTVAAATYQVVKGETRGRIVLADAAVWPTTVTREDAVVIEFTAGYGANETDVPEPIRAALKLLVGHWYDAREAVAYATNPQEMPLGVAALLSTYRVMDFT
jgi:uncharacterized phiE125 gp8 family phage protein